MPTKPAEYPKWADTVASGDIATPPSGQQNSGYVKTGSPAKPQKPPYQWTNWLFKWIYRWIIYFEALTDTLKLSTPVWWGGTTAAGVRNTYTLTISGFPVNASIATGTILFFRIDTASGSTNTDACTLAINGQAALYLKDKLAKALKPATAKSGQYIRAQFDGTGWTTDIANPVNTVKWFVAFNGRDSAPIYNSGVILTGGGAIGTITDATTGNTSYGPAASIPTTGGANDLAYIAVTDYNFTTNVFSGNDARVKCLFKFSEITNRAFFLGFFEARNSFPTTIDAATVSALLGGNINAFGLWYDSANNANLRLVACAGDSANARNVDTGIAADTSGHTLEFRISAGTITGNTIITCLLDGAEVAKTETNTPFDGPFMYPFLGVQALDATIAKLDLGYIEAEQEFA